MTQRSHLAILEFPFVILQGLLGQILTPRVNCPRSGPSRLHRSPTPQHSRLPLVAQRRFSSTRPNPDSQLALLGLTERQQLLYQPLWTGLGQMLHQAPCFSQQQREQVPVTPLCRELGRGHWVGKGALCGPLLSAIPSTLPIPSSSGTFPATDSFSLPSYWPLLLCPQPHPPSWYKKVTGAEFKTRLGPGSVLL